MAANGDALYSMIKETRDPKQSQVQECRLGSGSATSIKARLEAAMNQIGAAKRAKPNNNRRRRRGMHIDNTIVVICTYDRKGW